MINCRLNFQFGTSHSPMFDGISLPKLQKNKTKRRLHRKIRRLNITPLSQKYKMAANFIMKTADRKQ